MRIEIKRTIDKTHAQAQTESKQATGQQKERWQDQAGERRERV